MRLLNRLKHLVQHADFFYSTEMLRFEEDLEYKTLTGGIISLGIIITIIVGFASMILNTLDLNTFNTSTQIIKNAIPPPAMNKITDDSPFRFAIQIWKQNLSDTKRYFDITFTEVQQSYGVPYNRTDIKLQACTKDYFKDYPDVVKNFDKLMAGYWLCPQMNTYINVSGKYSSEYYNQQIVMVAACYNATDPSRPCATPEEIQKYFDQNQQFFYFDFYFTNPQINPDKKSYKQYYLQDMTYAIFGSGIGSQTFLYFSDYTVSTDYSIWSFTNTVEDKGLIVENNAMNHNFQTNINNYYIYFSLAKSSNSIIYNREVQKLSAVFSFMGGMIGAVSAVLFIIKVYTSLSFQFSIAFEIFKRKDKKSQSDQKFQRDNKESGEEQKTQSVSVNNSKLQEINMHFLNFIRFHFYNLLQILGFKKEWPQMDYAKQCKDQILKQLDIRLLLKRIIFLQHCLTYLIDDFQLDALQLKKPQSPKEVKRLRQKCQSLIDHEQSQNNNSQSEKQYIQPQVLNNHCVSSPKSFQTPNRMLSIYEKDRNHDPPNQSAQSFLKNNQINNRKQSIFDQNDVVIVDRIIVDISSMKEDFRKQDDNKRPIKCRQSSNLNNIGNSYRQQTTTKTYLLRLHQNALEGNEVSNKIWNSLDINIRNSIEKEKYT